MLLEITAKGVRGDAGEIPVGTRLEFPGDAAARLVKFGFAREVKGASKPAPAPAPAKQEETKAIPTDKVAKPAETENAPSYEEQHVDIDEVFMRNIDGMMRDELMNELAAAGVPYKNNDSKSALQEKVRALRAENTN